MGRAMDRVVTVAKELGMLEGLKISARQDAYGYLRARMSWPCSRVRRGSRAPPSPRWPSMSIRKSLSPKVIGDLFLPHHPGKEKEVGRIVNALVKQGRRGDQRSAIALVHVSGHPRRGELARLYDW